MLRVCRCWSKPKIHRARHELKMYPRDILNTIEFFEIHNLKSRLSLCNVSFFMNNTHIMISALQLFWPNKFISMTIHFSLHRNYIWSCLGNFTTSAKLSRFEQIKFNRMRKLFVDSNQTENGTFLLNSKWMLNNWMELWT